MRIFQEYPAQKNVYLRLEEARGIISIICAIAGHCQTSSSSCSSSAALCLLLLHHENTTLIVSARVSGRSSLTRRIASATAPVLRTAAVLATATAVFSPFSVLAARAELAVASVVAAASRLAAVGRGRRRRVVPAVVVAGRWRPVAEEKRALGKHYFIKSLKHMEIAAMFGHNNAKTLFFQKYKALAEHNRVNIQNNSTAYFI
jgi:hypothetical protein